MLNRLSLLVRNTAGAEYNVSLRFFRRLGEIAAYLLLAAFIPAVIRHQVDGVGFVLGSSGTNSIALASLASIVVVLLSWKFASHKKVGRFSTPAIAVGVAYGAVFVAIILFRIEYARFQLFASIAVSFLLAYSIHHLRHARQTGTFGFIPAGRAADAESLTGYNWLRVEAPALPGTKLDGLVADLDHKFDDTWNAMIAKATLAGIPVYHYQDLAEQTTGMVRVNALSERSFRTLDPDNHYVSIKYAGDALCALIALPLLSPLLFAIWIWIRLDSPGPGLFTQDRVGASGRIFTIYKFRTMNADGRADIATTDGDPRITRAGAILRKYRIDELPQIINILRGEMSWIGPRPESVSLAEVYQREVPLYAYRHMLRPGLSGWAQIHQGNTGTVDAARVKLSYDFYYIKHVSLWLDMAIAIKTLQIVITGQGSK